MGVPFNDLPFPSLLFGWLACLGQQPTTPHHNMTNWNSLKVTIHLTLNNFLHKNYFCLE